LPTGSASIAAPSGAGCPARTLPDEGFVELPANGRVQWNEREQRMEETAHRRAVTDALTGKASKIGQIREKDVTTLSHVTKAQEELLARLVQIEEVVSLLHANLVGDMPKDDPDRIERSPNTAIEALALRTLGHLEVADRIDLRLQDLSRVLQ
jgi:hypothetical protein